MEDIQERILNSREKLVETVQFQHISLFFIMIKSIKNIHNLNIFDNKYLYTANADETTFFHQKGRKVCDAI